MNFSIYTRKQTYMHVFPSSFFLIDFSVVFALFYYFLLFIRFQEEVASNRSLLLCGSADSSFKIQDNMLSISNAHCLI